MRDLPPAVSAEKRAVEWRLADFISRFGYAPLEVPILEATELFLRKSGGDLASRMYSFTDPGSNPVSLRPEFTSAIMRHYLETNGDSSEAPLARWQYAGPVFRYDAGNIAGRGQFTQVGAELVGSDSVLADAELLALAAGIPTELGISGCVLRLADLDVLDSVLDSVGLADRARAFIVSNMNRIGDNQEGLVEALRRAAELHIVSGIGLPEEESHLAAAVAGMSDGVARSVLAGFMRWNASPDTPLGRRSPDEIIDRLLRKLRGGDAPDAIERGLALASQLAAVRGDPASALPQAQSIVAAAGADSAAIDRMAQLVSLVNDEPSVAGCLRIDFSLARGISYYNGIIFDIVQGDDEAVLGGGGRYNALARALGAPGPVPALGFAYTLELLLAAMTENDRPAPFPDAVLVIPDHADDPSAALRAVADLRRQGNVAILDVGGNTAKGQYVRTITA
jgi:histidyl-tRNA synthetase